MFGIKFFDCIDRGVLQVVNRSQSGLLAVGMMLEKKIVYCPVNEPVFIIYCPVFFFINRFQFGVKESEHWLGKAFTFDLCPVFQAIGWKINLINRLLMPSVSVQTFGTHVAVSTIHFIWNRPFCSLSGEPVNLRIDFRSFGFVGLF